MEKIYITTFSELDLTLAKFASILNSRLIAIIMGDIKKNQQWQNLYFHHKI